MENSKIKGKKLRALLPILTFLLLVVLVVYLIQPSMFFYPYHHEEAYTKLKEKDSFKEIIIPHGKGQLHGWLRYHGEGERAPLLIFYGGNGQNSSYYSNLYEQMDVYSYFQGYHVLFVDYPGYGLSDGSPTEKSLFSAGLAVYDYAQDMDCAGDKTVILGYSIGTGVASYVASQREADGLILLAPFDRGLSLYNDALNIFHGPLKALARFKFDSVTYARRISVPTLIIASKADEVIPYTHAQELSKHFSNLADFVLTEDASHDNFFFSQEILGQIQTYLLIIQENS